MINGAGGTYVVGVQAVSLPPGTSGNASNGVSIDPISGDVVLGNSPGAPGDPAQLLDQREILLAGNLISFLDNIGLGRTEVAGSALRLLGTGAGSFLSIEMAHGTSETFQIVMAEGSNVITFNCGLFGSLNVAAIDQPNGNWQFGPGGLTTFNGASVQVTGTITGRALPKNIGGMATYSINRSIDSHVMFYNTDATVDTTMALPNMALATFDGFYFYAASNDAAFNILIEATNGERIYLNGVAGLVNGGVLSTAPGTMIHMISVDPVTWIASDPSNTWVAV
jgi:hypothetical protein